MKKLNSCCKEELSMIKYYKKPFIIGTYKFRVIKESGNLYRCGLCKKIIGTCTFCDKNYGFPVLMFIDEGKKGMIAICRDCLSYISPLLKPVKT